MKLDQGSSRFFIATAVLFTGDNDARHAGKLIDQARRKMGLKEGFEFHFTETKDTWRHGFFSAIRHAKFRYSAFVLNKAAVQPGRFRHARSLYKCCVRFLFENLAPYLVEQHVIIDRSGDRNFRRELNNYLMNRINPAHGPLRIRGVTAERSHNNNLVQLADMTCGAVARSLQTHKKRHDAYRKMIIDKELQRRIWPR